jgi:hypothetical protein
MRAFTDRPERQLYDAMDQTPTAPIEVRSSKGRLVSPVDVRDRPVHHAPGNGEAS